jgi:hypothetical protein
VPASVADLLVELATLTGLSPAEWRDFCSLPPDAQQAVARAYRDQDWSRSPDTLSAVLGVLRTLAAVAADVSGIAGAASAISAISAVKTL